MATVIGFVLLALSALLAAVSRTKRFKRLLELARLKDKHQNRITDPADHLSTDPAILRIEGSEDNRVQDLELGRVVPTEEDVQDLLEESRKP